MAILQHPWLTRIHPSAVFPIGNTRVEIYSLAPTNLHRLPAGVLILPTDPTLRMVRGIRKEVRDYGGYRLIEDEATSLAPLPQGGIALTSGGRTRFHKIAHPNLYDAHYTTNSDLQREALRNAFEVALQQGANTVAVADYTIDLRRALAEETAYTLLEAWQPFTQRDLTLEIVTTRPINGWAFKQVICWIAQNGLKPYPHALRIRHTILHATQTPNWIDIPTEGVWHFTDSNLGGTQSPIARRGGPILQQKIAELAPIELGHCTIFHAGNLPQKFVVSLAVVSDSTRSLSLDALVQALPKAFELSHHQNLTSVLIPLPEGQGEPFVQAVLDATETYLYRELFTRIERLVLASPQSPLWHRELGRRRALTQLPQLSP
ncbi:MAG: hypothetical protein C4336_06210 [Armatimonadota bacterium]